MSASNDLEWVDSSVDNCKFKTKIPYRHKLLQNTHNDRHFMEIIHYTFQQHIIPRNWMSHREKFVS